jgi:hypothetical protein
MRPAHVRRNPGKVSLFEGERSMRSDALEQTFTWGETDYLKEMRLKFGDQVAKAVEGIVAWSRENGL